MAKMIGFMNIVENKMLNHLYYMMSSIGNLVNFIGFVGLSENQFLIEKFYYLLFDIN